MEHNKESAVEVAKSLLIDASVYEYQLFIASTKQHGISGWFKAFIASDDFSKLDPNLKKEAFAAYEGLQWFLNKMENYDKLTEAAELLD